LIPTFEGKPMISGPLYKLSLATAALLLTCAHAQAAERVFECRWAEAAPKIDGVADEAVWESAETIDRFYLPWLEDKVRDAKTATKAKLLWDREYLYFFAEMEDGDLYADIDQKDGKTWLNDVFELFFKPSGKHPGYYEFQVSAAGTTMDMFIPRRGGQIYERFIGDGDFEFLAKVKRDGTLNKWTDSDKGWTVEGRFRWRDFARSGGRPNPRDVWKFALCRYDYSVDFEGPELSTCAPLTKLSFHQYEDYAPLKFVGSQGQNAARPYGVEKRIAVATSKIVHSPEPPLPYQTEPAYPQLELKNPLAVYVERGTKNLLSIQNVKGDWGTSRLVRFPDQQDAAAIEQVVGFPGVAYGFAYHPQFAENGFVYVGMNLENEEKVKVTRVVRYTIDKHTNNLDADSATTIIDWPSDGHNGGDLVFDSAGLLYVTAGDGTSDSDGNLTGQDLSNLMGSVVRIDVDHPQGDMQYSIPSDNPFVKTKGARGEIWAYGLRNPWKMTIDPQSDRIWVGNNGQDLWEQVYLIEKAANYGWSIQEGSHPFYLNREQGPTPIQPPAAEHSHSESRSLTGGVVYHGDKLPQLRGMYIYGDYSTGKIWGLGHDGKKVLPTIELADTSFEISGFGLDTQGELLIIDYGGAFHRLIPNQDQYDPQAFPRKLSQTGLFADTTKHQVEQGVIPYSVNSPLWSDGAYKERFIALPQEDATIDMTARNSWGFPDQTVLIKSFALEASPGDPASRRWVETRLLTRQEGEWIGYSYRWNQEQTDAFLVESKGKEETIALSGDHSQAWRFPSRAECMTCHSRAASFVLGLSTAQMNKDHDYGHGVVDNQLRTLEHLGLLQTDWAKEVREAEKKEAEAAGKTAAQANAQAAALFATRMQKPIPKARLLSYDPAEYPSVPNPYDETAPLVDRARSYLNVNCASCHTAAGGGNSQIELTWRTDVEKMKLIDAPPLHHKFDINNPLLVAPGAPDRSVLLHRMRIRGAGQMPPLASAVVDEQAVKLITDWIASQKK